MSRFQIFPAESDAEILDCFEAFQVLRPHLDRPSFLSQVRRQQGLGYRIVASRAQEPEGLVVSAAGFRLAEFLAWGKVLYIDDLTTLPQARGEGAGGTLLAWLEEHAREQGCSALHLDTGYGRHDAHRLYLRRGFELSCHHMTLEL